MNKPQRLFFALWPDERLREAIARETHSAVDAGGGRAIPTRNLHATLAFLGNVAESRLAAVYAAAESTRGRPLEVALEQVDTWRKAETLVLGAQTIPPRLQDLVDSLHERLRVHGFVIEERPFRFHVSLARKVKTNQRFELRTPLRWPVNEFALVRSDLKPGGSDYTVLEQWSLENTGNSRAPGV